MKGHEPLFTLDADAGLLRRLSVLVWRHGV
jgi:hypothetical protein